MGVCKFLGFPTRGFRYRDVPMEKGYAHMVSIYSCRGSSSFYRFMGCYLSSRLSLWLLVLDG